MQEGNEVAGAPLVGFREVDVFEIEDQVLTIFGSEDAARVRAEQQAGLTELLQDVTRRGLGAAVNHGDLGGAEAREGVAEEHAREGKGGKSQINKRQNTL